MKQGARGGSDLTAHVAIESLGQIPLALLDDPLEFLLAQQRRQRTICGLLRQIAAGQCVDSMLAKPIVDIVTNEQVLQRSDEEADIFPLMRCRARVEDGLTDLLNRLNIEAKHLRRMSKAVVKALSTNGRSGVITIGKGDAATINSYAAHLHRRLAVEHGILLVLARSRLTSADIETLSTSMKRRRGMQA